MRFRILEVSVFAVVLLCTAGARPAAAQIEPRATIAGGYTYLREQGPGDLPAASYAVGWIATGSLRMGSGRVSGVGEVGISMRNNSSDETQRLLGLFGGVRFRLSGSDRMNLFAQALIGMERFSEPGLTESGLAIQPGAGIDWTMWSRYFLRAQADYRMSRQTGRTFNDVRVLVGVGVRLGK